MVPFGEGLMRLANNSLRLPIRVLEVLRALLQAVGMQISDGRVLGSVFSILGYPPYLPANWPVSEYSLAYPPGPSAITTLLELFFIPPGFFLPATTGGPRNFCGLWRRTILREQPQVFTVPRRDVVVANNNGFVWIYVNGICTTRKVAEMNAQDLSGTFGNATFRVVYNPTDSIFLDIAEAGHGLLLNGRDMEMPARAVYQEIRQWLLDGNVSEVRVVAHSQGTIITFNAIHQLYNDSTITPQQRAKLWLFNFANCSNGDLPGQQLERTENFLNENDIVAQLHQGEAGSSYNKPNMSGHLLGEHYLPGLRNGEYTHHDGGNGSRLFQLVREA